MFLGMQDFDFTQILPKFIQTLPKFAQNLTKKYLLWVAAATISSYGTVNNQEPKNSTYQ